MAHSPTVATPWEALARHYAGHPALALDPFYAMPPRLLDALARHAPGLLLNADIVFERALCSATAGGLVLHGRAVTLPQLGHPGEQESACAGDGAPTLKVEDFAELLPLPHLAGRHLQERDRERRAATLRQAAYAGWLVCDPGFRHERDRLHAAHEDVVARDGRLPSLPLGPLGKPGAPARREDAPFHRFYRRWGLHTLLTWELPLPMAPQVGGAVFYDEVTTSASGLNVFVPWYALRDQRLALRDLFRLQRQVRDLAHLRGWLEGGGPGAARLGHGRYRNLLLLYRYRELALAGRYAERLPGRVMQVERAFAEYLGLGADSVKKLRKALPSADGVPRPQAERERPA
jgi:hypothetical protein